MEESGINMKKKILAIALVMFLSVTLVGCSCMKKTAKNAVEDFLNRYKNLSSAVITDLDQVVENEAGLTEAQKDQYRDILKKQYKDIKYEIVNETYDGDTAKVEAKITVYDLYKVQKEASTYLTTNADEFKDENGTYSNELFMDYKLDKMQKVTDTVEYTIEFNVTKDDKDNWQVSDVTNDTLEKIHGIYNYDNE